MNKICVIRRNSVFVFHIIVNIIFVVFVTGADYYHIPLNGLKDHSLYFVHLCLLQASVAGLLYFLSLNRLIFKLFFPFLFVLLGAIGFWVYSIDLSIGKALIDAAQQSKFYIIKDLLTWEFLWYGILLLGATYFILKLYRNIAPQKHFKYFSVFAIACFSLFFIMENKKPDTFKSKLPYNVFYSIKAYSETSKKILTAPKGVTFLKDTNVLKVVFVLGESVRADHLSINGYPRITTPLLAKRKNIMSRVVYTNKTYTAASLQQMLTNKSIYEDSIANMYSVYSVLNKANIETTWIGNQLLETDYKDIALSTDSTLIIDELKSSTSYTKSMDGELLPYLEEALKNGNDKLTTLHMIGSHWWYEGRYPKAFRNFNPVVDSKYMPSLNEEQLINSYDNTILYLDSFLDKVIGQLEKEETPTLMLYVSDHAESLGEDGKWLHASDSEELKHTALIVWYSDRFKKIYPDKVNALLKQSKEPLVTMDVVYYSLLDVFDVAHEGIPSNTSRSLFYNETEKDSLPDNLIQSQ